MAAALAIVKECDRCGSDRVLLRRHIISNGDYLAAWWCKECNRWAQKPVKWLSHGLIESSLERQGKSIDDVPVLYDGSDRHPCEICGAPGEWHHWAPRKYREEFGEEWWRWPGSYLCREHHQQWHRAITPELVYDRSA